VIVALGLITVQTARHAPIVPLHRPHQHFGCPIHRGLIAMVG
jgi:hypothetical protein